MTAHSHALTQNGRASAEASAPPAVTDQGPSHHGDTRNLSVRLTITQRCLETFKTLRIFEEVFGHVPVKNVAGRYRNAAGADEAEELCSGCGLYPARLNDLCVGCTVRGARLQRCTSCHAVLVDEARCSSCGGHQ